MFVFLILSVTIALAAGSQPSNYNAFNKQPQQQQFHNAQQSQTGHYQNYQHQTHHNQFNQQKQQTQQHHQAQPNYYQPQAQFQANRNFIPITQYKSDMSHDGSYQYSYSTANGIKADESGYLKNIGINKAQVVQGSYSYTSPEGIPIHVQYTADEYGFKASGAHLPTPPPIPEAIQKSLQLIARTQPAPATHGWQNQQQNTGAWQQQQQKSQQQIQQSQHQWQPQAHQKWN